MSFIGGPGSPPPPSQLGELNAKTKQRHLSDAAERYATTHPEGKTRRRGRIGRMFRRLGARLRRHRA